ncbi:MAG: hypothetical protein ABSG25_01145 [Bryobacteraceae bacterium]
MTWNNRSFEKESWERDEIGIWYGAWSASDLREALASPTPVQFLTDLPAQQKLGWVIRPVYYDTITRFRNIPECDWVWTCFDYQIHFAHAYSEIADDPHFDQDGERFKIRRIREKKSFDLRCLPDSFLLLTSAGRSNVYELNANGLGRLVAFLADSSDQDEVTRKLSALDMTEILNFFGPSSWESVCEAYLIRKEGFLPTGLHAGGTLKDFDIVGCDKMGRRVLAQCKKDAQPQAMEPTFVQACEAFPDYRLFYFAYGGCLPGNGTEKAQVVDRKLIEQWLKENQDYFQWLRFKSC